MKKVLKIVGIMIGVIIVLFIALIIAFKVNPEGTFNAFLKLKSGNRRRYAVSSVDRDEESPLNGKTVIFLGSSVTYGTGACGTAFPEYLEAECGIHPVKEAVGGTTLVTQDESSYIPRMESIDTEIKADLFMCQLSTNDATLKLPMGDVSDGFDLDEFDTNTIAGAIEYIIAYSKSTWDCPIVFFTNPQYDSEEYREMVSVLLKIKDKWGIYIIDLWNDQTFNDISEKERKLWMIDDIHPTMAGYRDWWMPVFRKSLEEIL